MKQELFIQRVNNLIQETDQFFPRSEDSNVALIDKTTFGTLALISSLYDDSNTYSDQIIKAREKYVHYHRQVPEAHQLMTLLRGILETIKYELENGLIVSLRSQIEGEVFGDFISLAKKLISDGQKDPAAVLACGALEDSLKKYATKHGLNFYDEDLSFVINSLKSKGLLKGAQSGVVQSYVQLRNKAFHAKFDKIDVPEISSLIAFVEQFLLQEFK